jgi:hypothetical protein
MSRFLLVDFCHSTGLLSCTLPPEVEPMSWFLLVDFCHSTGLLLRTLAPSPRAKVSAGVTSTKAAKNIALPDFKWVRFGMRII